MAAAERQAFSEQEAQPELQRPAPMKGPACPPQGGELGAQMGEGGDVGRPGLTWQCFSGGSVARPLQYPFGWPPAEVAG